MAMDGQWVLVSTDAFADAELLAKLSLNNCTKAIQKLLETNKIVTEISTVGNKQTIIWSIGTEICHKSIIDLTMGTPDKWVDLYGKEWTIDLYSDEDGTEVVGVAIEPVEMEYRRRILDHNLVEEYTVLGKTITSISVPAEHLLFDDEWVMSEITGLEAFYSNMPTPPPELQEVLEKFMKNEIPMTMVIKTTGDNRYIRRKTGDLPAQEFNNDLGIGTLDQFYDPFGTLYEMDLHWDETHRKMVGEGEANGQPLKITHEIVNGKLLERYQNNDGEVVMTHISSASIAFDGIWHRTAVTGLPKAMKKLNLENSVVKIKTVGDTRTMTNFFPPRMAKDNLVTTIDLTKGTPDKIRDIFGEEQTVDLYWDEVNKKGCGTSTNEKGILRVTHEILDGRLIQSFTTEKHNLLDKSPVEIKIISEPEGYRQAADFDGDWSMVQMNGMEELQTAYPQFFNTDIQKAFTTIFQKSEGNMVTRIKTTGENQMSRTRIFMTKKGKEIGRLPTSNLDLTRGSPDPVLGFLFGPGNTLDVAWNDNRLNDGHQMICGTGMIKGIECHVEMEIVDHDKIGEMLMETVTLGGNTVTRINVRPESVKRVVKLNQVKKALKTGIQGLREFVFAPQSSASSTCPRVPRNDEEDYIEMIL